MKNVFYFICAFLVVTSLTISQTRKQRIEAAVANINSLLQTYEDGTFQVGGGIVDIDSSIGHNGIADGNIQDPYGTLLHAFLFIAKSKVNDEEYKYITGIFRNNQILWTSEPVFDEKYKSTFFNGSFDLNKDGKVDIITVFGYGPKSEYEIWWIYSWDGVTGSRISAVTPEGYPVIQMFVQSYSFIDINGDGILEIIGPNGHMEGEAFKTEKNAVFCWNGSFYGEWPNCPSIVDRKFPVANNLGAEVKCKVYRKEDSLMFNYKVLNKPTSKQPLAYFYISEPTLNSNYYGPQQWASGHLDDINLASFITPSGESKLEPGESNNEFALTTTVLPKISGFYIQALYGYLTSTTDQEGNDNIFNNSIKGTTIAPGFPPSPFAPINFLDTLSSYTTQSRSLGWIINQPTADKYLNYFATSKQQLQSNNTNGARQTLQTVVTNTISDSMSNLTSEAYALLRFNTEYLISQLPQETSGLPVKLISSAGTNLTTGTLQYYEGSWRDASNNGDGTFTVSTTKPTISLRMTYEYGTQQKNNITVGSEPVIFQTVNAQVKLQNSQGSSIDTGTVQYYAGAWRTFGTTANGTASKELLANNYSFRMTYAYGSNDKAQDLNANPVVVFQTVNAAVQLKNSQGNLIDQGTVQYYSGAWRAFGSTTNGVARKEVLPNNYSFRMTYAYGSNDKQQNIGTNSTVVFSTVAATVRVTNLQNNPVNNVAVTYYSGAWRIFGTTSANGETIKELLPANLQFRAKLGSAQQDKTQNLSSNPVVEIQLNVNQ